MFWDHTLKTPWQHTTFLIICVKTSALCHPLHTKPHRNLDKPGDFVNGMECVVKAWDEAHRCLQVETITGKQLAVYQYTDPDPKAQNASFFPIRLGYASTIYKMQGAELEHVTIYLDVPGQRAAAYVAMSRVKRDEDYLFGGKYSRKHFVPNA